MWVDHSRWTTVTLHAKCERLFSSFSVPGPRNSVPARHRVFVPSTRPEPQLQPTNLQHGVREEAWRTGGRGGAEEAGEEEDFELQVQLQLALRAAEEAAIAEEDAVLAAEEAELSAEEAKYAAEQARLNAIAARQRLRQHSRVEQVQHATPGRRRFWSDLVADPEVPSTVEIPPRGLPPPALLPPPTGEHALLPVLLQRRGLPAPTWKRLREAQRISVQWEMALSSDRCELLPSAPAAALAAETAEVAEAVTEAAAAATTATAEDDVLDRELAALEAEEAELDRLEALEAALVVTLETAKTKHWLLQHVPPPNVITNVTPLQLVLPPRPHAMTQLEQPHLQPHLQPLQPGASYMYVPANPLLQAQEPLPPLPPHPQVVVGRPILGTAMVPPGTATSKKWFRMRAWFGGGDATRNVVNV